MDSQTLTDRLNNKADSALESEIGKLAKEWEKYFPFKFHESVKLGSVDIQVSSIVSNLRKLAFESYRETARQKVITDFMAKVERLGDEIDQLRNELVQ